MCWAQRVWEAGDGLLRVVCFILIAAGGVITLVTAWRFHRFLRYSRAESYGLTLRDRTAGVLSQVVMVFFIIGFVVGALDVALRDVEPIYLFVGFVFFVGAIFIAMLVQSQIHMAASLREKSLEVMRTFVNAIEVKDSYTRGHSLHVYEIVELFCQYLLPRERGRLNIPKLLDAAILHDIGKIGVEDRILNKAGPLTEEEWEQVRSHPRLSAHMLEGTTFLEIAPWVLYHHERVDGKGYYKLSGAEIPLESRIISVADTYSAITTDRVYRPRRTHDQAIGILREVAGTQLDARLVECFCQVPKSELEALSAAREMVVPPGV